MSVPTIPGERQSLFSSNNGQGEPTIQELTRRYERRRLRSYYDADEGIPGSLETLALCEAIIKNLKKGYVPIKDPDLPEAPPHYSPNQSYQYP